MHLGVYQEPVHTDGAGYDTYGPFARYLNGLARHFDQVTVFAPTTAEDTYFSGHPLLAGNLTVVPLPFFMTHAQAYRKAFRIWRAFRRHARGLDAVIARGTAPLAYLLYLLTPKRCPFLYHFASDPFEIIRTSPKYRGPKGWFARAAYGLEFAIQKYIVRRNFAFASGQAVCERIRRITPNVEGVVTSALAEEDYFGREDTCRDGPIRLLYVGYLRPEKRVDDLLRAAGLLRDRGVQVRVDVAGEGAIRSDLQKLGDELGLSGQVWFHGYVRMGPPLNALFNAADIFVLPSISEGSPKVVLEAMAHSLPVVATAVGNVPEMLEEGSRGVLVPPLAPEKLAEGIARLVDDGPFRRECIRGGYTFARQHSVDEFVRTVAERVKALVAQRRQGREP
ncbi:MAG TPA: glycosyltransferase family 4 protein [Phycisphaerae bacterium]|nr:glycosyltransferase family 4 protein [Phycisphaerae bacterium]